MITKENLRKLADLYEAQEQGENTCNTYIIPLSAEEEAQKRIDMFNAGIKILEAARDGKQIETNQNLGGKWVPVEIKPLLLSRRDNMLDWRDFNVYRIRPEVEYEDLSLEELMKLAKKRTAVFDKRNGSRYEICGVGFDASLRVYARLSGNVSTSDWSCSPDSLRTFYTFEDGTPAGKRKE